MNVKTYTNPAEMFAALRQAEKDKAKGLHPAQSTLSFGDYWIALPDLMFGRVWTLEEIAEDAGPDYAEASCDLAHKDQALGLLYGCSHSHGLPTVRGYVHKEHLWPIDKELFAMAESVEWDWRRLDEAGRLLLDHAVAGWTGHTREQASR